MTLFLWFPRFPPLKDRPVAEAARHVTADAAADQDQPEQRHGQGRCEVNKETKTEVEEGKQSLAPMRPARIVQPFQNKEQAAGEDGQVVPEGQAGKRHQEESAAKEHRGHADMAGSRRNAEPAHGAGRPGLLTGGIGLLPDVS